MKYVFSKEKFLASNNIKLSNTTLYWVNICDGKEVTFEENEIYGEVKGVGVEIAGKLEEFMALKEWCEGVE